MAPTSETKTVAGESPRTDQEIKGKIVEFLWYMKKQGYAPATIRSRVKLLKRLAKLNVDLNDAEDVKKAIAVQSWCEGRKSNACDTYSSYLKMQGKKWDRPIYKKIAKLPFIPQELEIDQLIAACSPRMACFLQLLKETGMRPGEAWQMQLQDIDTITRTVRVTPEKGSNPRIFHISQKLSTMLEQQPQNYGDRVFSVPQMPLNHHIDHLRQQRKRVARKLGNNRIERITFKTFRHWKGTIEYHRTLSLLHVQQILGHKNPKNTMIYIHLAKELFKNQQQYVSRIAYTAKESCSLIDAGFDYVTGEYKDGGKIFRKRKDYA